MTVGDHAPEAGKEPRRILGDHRHPGAERQSEPVEAGAHVSGEFAKLAEAGLAQGRRGLIGFVYERDSPGIHGQGTVEMIADGQRNPHGCSPPRAGRVAERRRFLLA
ncbi:MAG: hypothetical protein GY925_05595 [Actinomycetia bacterium]|nr:hypothetical protein [Actinomycetes bacterium]